MGPARAPLATEVAARPSLIPQPGGRGALLSRGVPGHRGGNQHTVKQQAQAVRGQLNGQLEGAARDLSAILEQTVYAEPVAVLLREARRQWAELLRRIFKVEPLECPRCGQTMRIVAFITEPRAIDRSLDHLRRIRNGKAPFPVPRPREPGGFALRPVPVPPRERCCTGSPGSWVRGYLGRTGCH